MYTRIRCEGTSSKFNHGSEWVYRYISIRVIDRRVINLQSPLHSLALENLNLFHFQPPSVLFTLQNIVHKYNNLSDNRRWYIVLVNISIWFPIKCFLYMAQASITIPQDIYEITYQNLIFLLKFNFVLDSLIKLINMFLSNSLLLTF
jgi:hypothetical protein